MGLHRKRTTNPDVNQAEINREFSKPARERNLAQFLYREDVGQTTKGKITSADLMRDIDMDL